MNLVGHMGALFSARVLAPLVRMLLIVGIARMLGDVARMALGLLPP